MNIFSSSSTFCKVPPYMPFTTALIEFVENMICVDELNNHTISDVFYSIKFAFNFKAEKNEPPIYSYIIFSMSPWDSRFPYKFPVAAVTLEMTL